MHRSHSLTSGKLSSVESEPEEDAVLLKEKLRRLMESHHRLLKVNQNLEDKLLRVVSNSEDEKALLREQINNLTEGLVSAQTRVDILEKENKKYREDCLLAVELLQCNPSHFVDHDFDSLPLSLRTKLNGTIPAIHAPDSSSCERNSPSADPESRPGSDIGVFPLPFPPSAVMVPYPHRRDSPQNSFATYSPSHSRRVSVGSIASIIDKDLQDLELGSSSRSDLRSRLTYIPQASIRPTVSTNRILHV